MTSGGWSSLPGDLLKEVSARLPSDADLLHVHQVCPQWRASTSLPGAFRPWVLAGRARRSGLVPIGEYSLRLPRRGARRMELGAPPSSFPYCCGASLGWLVDDDRSPTRLVLWDPLSSTEIPLPCPSPLTRIFLSGDPLTSSNWVAIASQRKGLIGQKTLLWRHGDAGWTMMYRQGTFEIDTVAFHAGKAYYIDKEKTIIICDLTAAGNGDASPPKCTQIRHVCSAVSKLCRCDDDSGPHAVRGVHLVVCDGELLLVLLRLGGHPSPAEVYKPEWTPDLRVELRERVLDLGDYSLFVGQGDTFALSAKEFPVIRRNCVYYVDKPQRQQHWVSVFHLESDVLEEVAYPEELKDDATNWTPYSWFCPRTPLLMQQ